jgi:hypothetical protein
MPESTKSESIQDKPTESSTGMSISQGFEQSAERGRGDELVWPGWLPWPELDKIPGSGEEENTDSLSWNEEIMRIKSQNPDPKIIQEGEVAVIKNPDGSTTYKDSIGAQFTGRSSPPSANNSSLLARIQQLMDRKDIERAVDYRPQPVRETSQEIPGTISSETVPGKISHKEILDTYLALTSDGKGEVVRAGIKGALKELSITQLSSREVKKYNSNETLPKYGFTRNPDATKPPEIHAKLLESGEVMLLVRLNNGFRPEESTVLAANLRLKPGTTEIDYTHPGIILALSELDHRRMLSEKPNSITSTFLRGEFKSEEDYKEQYSRRTEGGAKVRSFDEDTTKGDSEKIGSWEYLTAVEQDKDSLIERLRNESTKTEIGAGRVIGKVVDTTNQAVESLDDLESLNFKVEAYQKALVEVHKVMTIFMEQNQFGELTPLQARLATSLFSNYFKKIAGINLDPELIKNEAEIVAAMKNLQPLQRRGRQRGVQGSFSGSSSGRNRRQGRSGNQNG